MATAREYQVRHDIIRTGAQFHTKYIAIKIREEPVLLSTYDQLLYNNAVQLEMLILLVFRDEMAGA
jgi:hypothetical protein